MLKQPLHMRRERRLFLELLGDGLPSCVMSPSRAAASATASRAFLRTNVLAGSNCTSCCPWA